MKHQFLTLAIAIILICPAIIFGQATYETVVDGLRPDYVSDAIKYDTKGYFYCVRNKQGQIQILKLDKRNQPIFIKTFENTEIYTISELYCDSEDNVLITGLTNNYRVFISKFTEFGQQIFSKVLNYSHRAPHVRSNRFNDIIVTTTDANHSWINILDQNGTLIKSNEFSIENTTTVFYSSSPTDDGGWILDGAFVGSSGAYDLAFLRFSRNGTLIWSKRVNSDEMTSINPNIWAASIAQTAPDKFVVSGRYGDDLTEMNAFLCEFDLDGNVQRFKKFISGISQFSYFYNFKVLIGKGYATGSPGYTGTGSLLVKLDENWNVVKDYYTIGRHYNFHMDVHGNSIGICGGRTENGVEKQWIWQTNEEFIGICDRSSQGFTNKDIPYNIRDISYNELNSASITDFPLIDIPSDCVRAQFDFCGDPKDSSFIVSHIYGPQQVRVIGIDSVYCSDALPISLIGKGAPAGGIFKINGNIVSEINPATLPKNTMITLLYE